MNLWQRTDQFPQVEFVLVSFEPAAGTTYTAQGQLRLHGMEHLVAFPVSVTAAPRLWAFDGEVPADTRNYNLPIITLFVMLKVDPVVRVRFHLQGDVSE
jgi:polyisoprenoid-binding protein YceI